MEFLNDPIVLSILRLAHIFFGIIWVGFGVTGVLLIHPVAKSMGEKGDAFMRTYYSRSNVNKIFPVAAIVTTAAGLIMWPARVDGMDFIGFGNTGDYVMIAGALIGLLAFGHGAGATGRFSSAFAKVALEYENGDESKKAELDSLRAKVFTHSNVSAIMTVIAAVAMASARYL